jgi:FkbH-like protein
MPSASTSNASEASNFTQRTSERAVNLRACAKALRLHDGEVLNALIQGTTYARENRFQDSPEQLSERVRESLTLLIRHLEGGEESGSLYVGLKVFELTRLERDRAENRAEYERAVNEEEHIYLTFLMEHASSPALESFRIAFRLLTAGLIEEAPRHVRALFIGDCLIVEILGFLIAPLMDEGISIDPYGINPRDPAQLSQMLDSLSTKNFDVVLFSPFSHTRLPEIAKLLEASSTFASRRQIEELVTSAISQTQDLLLTLSQRFECPIFVHNAGLVVRGSNSSKICARLLLTNRARAIAGRKLNQWLADWVGAVNAATFQHIFVLDEESLARQVGRLALGRYVHTSPYQHSVVFSRHLAREYRRRISAVGRLLGKKLIVCDLDNTLWEGLIGEGNVTHHRVRQENLKRLKDHCGIVLSIASKNETANVHFRGGLLEESDFVAPQISWGHKSDAISNIKKSLNLQTKHMVFLDDRAEERALVREAFPDILALDPCDPETWRLMELWGDMTFGSSDLDRTRLYKEQSLRDTLVGVSAHGESKTDSDALKTLGLVMTIGQAERGDLKRIAELINRTNQWNLCGTRASYEQVRAWYEAEGTEILVGKVADRFGDMGTVCVAVVKGSSDSAELPVFVLSCRAFGYGIESAMLADIGRRFDIGGRRRVLRGLYQSNAQNHPCRNMYSDHGFSVVDGKFEWTGAPAIPPVPWLKLQFA